MEEEKIPLKCDALEDVVGGTAFEAGVGKDADIPCPQCGYHPVMERDDPYTGEKLYNCLNCLYYWYDPPRW